LNQADEEVWFGEESDKSQPHVLPGGKYSKIEGRQDEHREGRELSSGARWLCVKKVCLRCSTCTSLWQQRAVRGHGGMDSDNVRVYR
jgi:hypothetical protein